ncbi:MAG: hypothetical protein AB8I80_16730 [Anaerolineae bacterium]|jgi:hypothetical protein
MQIQDIPPGPPPTPQPPIIRIDLTAWPKIQTHIPVTVPVQYAITALENTLAQLRELYIQAEIQRRLDLPVGDRAGERDGA